MIGAVKSYKMIVKGDDDITKIQEKHETANKLEGLFFKFRVALPEYKTNKKKKPPLIPPWGEDVRRFTLPSLREGPGGATKKISFRRHILPFSAVI